MANIQHREAPQRRTVVIALIVAFASFMQMLDSSVIAVAIPRMALSFGTSPVALGLGITAYVTAASIVIPASAWAADRIGPRRLFAGALIGFIASSVLCGASSSLGTFVAARVVQGAAGALMGPVGQIILLRSVEREEMLRAMNISSAPMLVAPILGPPLGGLITSTIGWPWIFYLNVPIGLIGVVFALRALPDPRGTPRSFDLAGFLLNAAALAPLLYGLGELTGATIPVGAALTLVAIGLVIGAFAVRHALRAAEPLLSLEPRRFPTFRMTTLTAIPFVRLPITALPFALPILLQLGFGMSPFASGLLFLGHTAGDLSMKLFTTRVFRRFGYRTTLIACTTGMALTIATCGSFTRATPIAVMLVVLYVSGCCRSYLMTGLTSLSFADIPKPMLPSATTLNQVVMQIVTALGIALASLAIEGSILARGGTAGMVAPVDCRITLAILATLALLAVPAFLRLHADAGAVLSGHRAGRREAASQIEE